MPKKRIKVTKVVRLRPEVDAFAQLMEAKLRENDHKSGWKKDKTHALLARLLDETEEFIDSLSVDKQGHRLASHHVRLAAQMMRHWNGEFTEDVKGSHAKRISEAVDIANFAMMLVDVLGGL